jgi:hypothetical protein
MWVEKEHWRGLKSGGWILQGLGELYLHLEGDGYSAA